MANELKSLTLNGTKYVSFVDQTARSSVGSALLYTPQTLTEEQKAQARENIGAASEDDLNDAVAELEDKIASGGTGDAGATFIPYVSVDGIISWTNDKNLPNPDPVNIKGGKGDPGANGKDGYTPVKGTDYFTESDKEEIVNLVIAALPDGDEVAY